ncbi:MAG: Hsp20/alpha crystallin family protein [Oscillospiraceae bacterium]|nr:Hsp20/alpha crystallin family protein [Oscillospiraceae bacterium]
MNRDKNELSLFNNNDYGLFPRGFFPSFFNEGIWDGFNFSGFRVDVRDKKDQYIIEAEMPGIDKKNVNLEIEDNMLKISANINEKTEQKDEDGRYIRRERRTGSFRRSFSLENIKADEIKAEMNNGILTIYCPKKSETTANTRRIQIQ